MAASLTRRAVLGTALAIAAAPAVRADGSWPSIREMLFAGRELHDGAHLIALEAPGRAHDAGLVPMAVRALVPQTPERFIKTIHLVIDENPAPIAAVFHLAPELERVDVETRVRVNAYTAVHAIAETSAGELFVVERFVKASGGCSAPALKNPEEMLARLGRMRLRELPPTGPGELGRVQLLISHPSYTGMQIDQLSRNWIPPDYITEITVRRGPTLLLRVEADISLSEDPALTFALPGDGPDRLQVEVADSKGRRFAETWPIGLSS